MKSGVYLLNGDNKLVYINVLGALCVMDDGQSDKIHWGFTEKIEHAIQVGLLDYIGEL